MGHGLAGVGILLDKVDRSVQAPRRHGAAENFERPFEGTCVADDFDLAFLLQHGHDRVDIADGINLSRAQRAQCAGRCPDADKAHIAGFQAPAREHQIGHHVGRRARCRYAYFFAPQIGNCFVVGHAFGRHAESDLRRPALQHKCLKHLIFRLQVNGVFKGTRAHVGRAAHHRLQGPRTP